MITLLRATSLLMTLVSTSALAMPQPWIRDLEVVDLRSDAASLDFVFDYPGLGGEGGQPAPDCVALVTSGGDVPSAHDDALETLARGLALFDGDQILFPGPGRELNALAPVVQDRQLAFYFVDLGKYLTGLRIATKGGESLAALVKEAFGDDYAGIVALQVVRACRTLGPR